MNLSYGKLCLATILVFQVGFVEAQIAESHGNLRIDEALVDETSNEITLIGAGFIPSSQVYLGKAWGGNPPLSKTFISSTEIVAVLPQGMVPGTYLLTISKRTGRWYFDFFEFTIGAVGPEGPAGPTGPPGPPGPPGSPAGSGGHMFTMLDSQDAEIGQFVGIKTNNAVAPGHGPDDTRHANPSVLVLIPYSGDNYILPIFGSGFGATVNVHYTHSNRSGTPYINAIDRQIDASFDGLFGPEGPYPGLSNYYVQGNPDRSLLIISGPETVAFIESILIADGQCSAFGDPVEMSVMPLQHVVDLGPMFLPPFRMELAN